MNAIREAFLLLLIFHFVSLPASPHFSFLSRNKSFLFLSLPVCFALSFLFTTIHPSFVTHSPYCISPSPLLLLLNFFLLPSFLPSFLPTPTSTHIHPSIHPSIHIHPSFAMPCHIYHQTQHNTTQITVGVIHKNLQTK
jgi:hypothetical protein